MRNKVRKTTVKILEMIDEGILDRDTVINACLNYMSEADVTDMAECEGFIEVEDETEENADENDE